MEVKKTGLEQCYVIQPRVFEDERGYFYESFNKREFEEKTGIVTEFVQDNVSKSSYGVLRGLHFQIGDYAQAKLVSVSQGKVLDVVVDLRKESKSYGKVHHELLSEENKKQLFVPRGFAHGFVVLSEEAVFRYKCDNFYNKASERGINYKGLGVDWLLDEKDIIINDRDLNFPILNSF